MTLSKWSQIQSYLFAYFHQISSRQSGYIWPQLTQIQDSVIQILVVWFVEGDVVPERCLLYPGLLGDVCYLALGRHRGCSSDDPGMLLSILLQNVFAVFRV